MSTSIELSKNQNKKSAAKAHNEHYASLKDVEKVLSSRVIVAAQPSQRRPIHNKTSANSSKSIDRKRAQDAENKNKLIMKGRDKISALLLRAGIVSEL